MIKNKPLIWIYNLIPPNDIIPDLIESMEFNTSSDYYTYNKDSAGIMSEYDAVAWRSNNIMPEDINRSEQLISFLEKKSGIFIFLFDKFKIKGANSTLSIIETLLIKEFNKCLTDIIKEKIGKKFLITSAGSISPFREYLEYKPQKSYLSFDNFTNLTPLAVNVDKEPIAFSLKKREFYFYFLPSPVNVGHQKIFYQNLFEAISRIGDISEVVPSWTAKYNLPEIKKEQKKLDQLQVKISSLQDEISIHQKKLNQLIWLRDTLLARDGKNLEKAIDYVLKSIGINSIPGPACQEDITFNFKDKYFLAEIKGSTSSASEAHIKQLHAKLTMFQEREKIETKGVLIINPWRQYPPNDRENKERKIYPDPIMSLVKIWRFSLVTTLQIFEVYKLHLQEKLNLDKFINDLYHTIGPLENYKLTDNNL